MKRRLTEEEIAGRAEKLKLWFDWINQSYSVLLSRQESSSAPSGFAEPLWKKQKHALCNGKGCKECHKGKVLIEIVDPYSQDVHVGVQVNESASSKKAQAQAVMDSTIRILQRNARVRAGVEALPDKALGTYLRVARKPQGFNRVAKGLWLLSETRPSLYESLPSPDSLRAVVILMHRVVGGRFPNPPHE